MSLCPRARWPKVLRVRDSNLARVRTSRGFRLAIKMLPSVLARLPAKNKTGLPPPRHRAKGSRHHTKDKQRFVVSVVAYDSLPGHQFRTKLRTPLPQHPTTDRLFEGRFAADDAYRVIGYFNPVDKCLSSRSVYAMLSAFIVMYEI